jgi:hypothetical protein
MDSKFYHFKFDIDIPQANIFFQSVNIGEGALGFSGGTAPFGPPWLRACSAISLHTYNRLNCG